MFVRSPERVDMRARYESACHISLRLCSSCRDVSSFPRTTTRLAVFGTLMLIALVVAGVIVGRRLLDSVKFEDGAADQ